MIHGYESPIKHISETEMIQAVERPDESLLFHGQLDDVVKQLKHDTDEYIYQAVFKTGVVVDRDELIKAMNYDRDQYNKGYHDGKMDAVEHGHWEQGNHRQQCSRCHRRGCRSWAFCPYCGTNMDEKEIEQ